MNSNNFDQIIIYMEKEMGDNFYHSERVSLLSYVTGKELDLDNDELELLYYAGLFHEIGKINLPKCFNVHDQNIKLEKIYPYLSKLILDKYNQNDKLNDIILKHNENFDGSGYPKGLFGDQIGLLATIIRISDFYDNCRINNNSHDDTIILLNKNGNKIFSKQIIFPFLKGFDNNKLQHEYF